MRTRAVVIGLDGGSPEVLGAMAARGVMPNLKGIMEEGVSRDLISPMPPVSGVSWVSFMTGMDPGSQGVYDWDAADEDGDRRSVTSGDVAGRTIWDALNGAGRRSLVFNVPVTYPPIRVDGVMVAGKLAPGEKSCYTHPASYREKIERDYPGYRVNVSHCDYPDTKAGAVRLIGDLRRLAGTRAGMLEELMAKEPWDFAMTVFVGTDRIQHLLWDDIERFVEGTPPAGADGLTGEILAYYAELDAAIGRIRKAAGEDACFFVVSDHGFGRCHGLVLMNDILQKGGFLRPSGRSGVKGALIRNVTLSGRVKDNIVTGMARMGLEGLARMLVESFGSRSSLARSKGPSAYAVTWWGVGITGAAPGTPGYEAFRDELVGWMSGLKDEVRGGPLFDFVRKREDVYSGAKLLDAPDVVFQFAGERYYAKFDLTGSDNPFLPPDKRYIGSHRRRGVFMAAGGAIRRARGLPEMGMADAAPTILYSMGIKPPAGMDGVVRCDLFEGEDCPDARKPRRPGRAVRASGQAGAEEAARRCRQA